MEPTQPPTPAAAQPKPEAVPNPEKTKAALELVQGIVSRMGVEAETSAEDRADGIHIKIKATKGGEALGGGRRSGVMESLAYLVNKSVNRDEAGRKWVFLDVEGPGTGAGAAPGAPAPEPVHVGEIDAATQALAEELAAHTKRLGGAVWIPVQGPAKGALQAALGKVAGVKVRAEGEGVHRRLVIEAA